MASSPSLISWRRWMWMARMPIPCLCSSRKSSHSPAMIGTAWSTTPNLSSGAQSAGTMWPGTSRSFSLVQTESPSSATAGGSSPPISRETSRSSSAWQTNEPPSRNVPSRGFHVHRHSLTLRSSRSPFIFLTLHSLCQHCLTLHRPPCAHLFVIGCVLLFYYMKTSSETKLVVRGAIWWNVKGWMLSAALGSR